MNEEKMDELLRLMRSVVPDTSDMSDAGRVGFVYRHNYDPAVQYEELDVVKFGMSLWTPKAATIGNPPPDQSQEGQENVEENEFWVMILPGALGSDYVKKTDIAKAPTETEQGKVGVVMPDGKTIQIDENGMMTGTPLDFMGTLKELQEGIASGEITEGMIGYIEGTPDNPEDPDHPSGMLIQIDDYPSLVSSNAVQNRIITAELNLIKELVEQNKQLIEETKALRSSIETFGLSKICPVGATDVTENNGMVLGAWEKNPTVEGTIGNLLNTTRTEFTEFKEKEERNFSCLGTVTEDQANNVIGYLGINGFWKVTGYQLDTGFAGYNRSFKIIGIDCTDELGNRTSTGVQIALTSHAEILKRKCRNGIWESWTEL